MQKRHMLKIRCNIWRQSMGAKYIKATRKPVKDICRFAQKHAEELDSISFVCRYEDKERLYTSLDKEIPNIYVTSSVPNLMEVGHI